MTKEKEKQLFEQFDFFKPLKPPQETLMCFGFECGDGWFNIIWELCEKIEKELDKYPELKYGVKYKWYEVVYDFICHIRFCIKNKKWIRYYKYPPFEVIQVKEKFGTLRFYTNFETKEIGDYIIEAEEKSAYICEICGKPGELRGTGWLETLCDECNKK